MKEIYLDNAASTAVYENVADYLSEQYKSNYANPSSAHKAGIRANREVEEATKKILSFYGLKDAKWNVYFTSGATESANLAIKGTMEKFDDPSKAKIITTQIEHPCVGKVCEYYGAKGTDTVFLPTDKYGRVDLEKLESEINDKTKIVSIIFVSNETGIIQDIRTIGKIIKKKNPRTVFHVDATQGYLEKLPTDDVDMISISAHKFHAPKGVGCLMVRKGITLSPIIHGGGHQGGIRSGTVNSPLIGAMALALETLKENDPARKVREIRNYLYEKVVENFGEDVVNSKIHEADYSPHILSISFDGLNGSHILYNLEEKGIYVSTSSACSTHSKEKSVLEKMGMTNKRAQGTVRISISEFTTKEDIDIFISSLSEITGRLKKLYRGK